MSSKSSSSKRGPLANAGGAPIKSKYKCIVPECSNECRGDKLKEHYLSKVDYKILSQVKRFSQDMAYYEINKIENLSIRYHTKYFFDKKCFTIQDIPSYKNHKRTGTFENINPFKRCMIFKGTMYKIFHQ